MGLDDYRRPQKKNDFIAEFKKKRSESGIVFFDLAAKESVGQFGEFIGGTSRSLNRQSSPSWRMSLRSKRNNSRSCSRRSWSTRRQPSGSSEREKPVKALGFFLEPPSISQKFDQLEGSAWTAFLASRAKALGLTLGASAAQFLCAVYQGNAWGLVTELQKLSGWALPKAVIEKGDLDAFDLEAAPNYWALLNGLKSADPKARLYALEKCSP